MESSCEQHSSASHTLSASPPSSTLQEDASSSTLALLAVADVPCSSPSDAANVATLALGLERCASELLLWLARSPLATSLADEALWFFETHHPELLDDLPLLFAWLSLFLAKHERSPSVSSEASRADHTVVEQFAAWKSTLTLLYYKHESERQERPDDSSRSNSRRKTVAFQAETELLQWVLARRHLKLTRRDILDHVIEEYPVFAASKSAAALKVWTSRFVKKHIGPHVDTGATKAVGETVPDVPMGRTEAGDNKSATAAAEAELVAASDVEGGTLFSLEMQTPLGLEILDTSADTGLELAAMTGRRHAGKRRPCSGRYMLFSNEFKLRAVHMVEQGRSVAEVAKELGLKSTNCLNYWRSIRDKLVTAEQKRFRLAGGGRRSSCTFEDELLTWVSRRHQQGQGTDAKAVLEYMKQHHSTFTEGKKEPTLRKWILRFFKRCWRAPCPSMDSPDAEKAYVFV
uniref:HTH CENPB-type domain-containing protein n=1 Tax=Peronospora matthiolae TaxID=2874970 RepID=A0AAV1V290_9STRA